MAAYALLADPLVGAQPGLVAAIAGGDAQTLDRIRRLTVIHRVVHALAPPDPQTRAAEVFRRHWPDRP